ncbi:MAG TPA: rhodanese family protein [Hyphomicrobiaceae bacterium]|nr:rhodanese family protein [Hyphomicrobiaceae bacterium]
MSLIPIKPEDAQRYIAEGAVLIDIREDDEHARECIPGARHAPMSRFGPIDTGDATAVIFHCRTGGRTTAASEKLAQAVKVKAYVLEGGLDAWKKAGLPVVKDKSQPIELQRQVQIAAGSLVLIGIALGSLVSPTFYALSAFVGAGLVFAGVSGFCGMARILAYMPWNRRSHQPATA